MSCAVASCVYVMSVLQHSLSLILILLLLTSHSSSSRAHSLLLKRIAMPTRIKCLHSKLFLSYTYIVFKCSLAMRKEYAGT